MRTTKAPQGYTENGFYTIEAEVKVSGGFWGRPVHDVVKECSRYVNQVLIEDSYTGSRADGKSIRDLLKLGAITGTKLTVRVESKPNVSDPEAIAQAIYNILSADAFYPITESGVSGAAKQHRNFRRKKYKTAK